MIDADRQYVYANPAACRMLGHPLEDLIDRDLLGSFPTREHAMMLAHTARFADDPSPFSCTQYDANGDEREMVYTVSGVEIDGRPHRVSVFRDLTEPRAAARSAVALAQTASQLIGSLSVERILDVVARHAVIDTRALVCGIAVAGEDLLLSETGEYGFPKPTSKSAWMASSLTIADLPQGAQILANKPVVLPDCRAEWEADPHTAAFAATFTGVDYQCVVTIPMSWEDHVFGFISVLLPTGLRGPSETELAFYNALADQAAVAVTNARLTAEAAQGAALLERTRLARDLHDSVSQALFSITMHARAAEMSMTNARLDPISPLGSSIGQLAELARSASAEMRALIFELRPDQLAEEGLVAALRKQASAFSTREQLAVTVEAPETPFDLAPDVAEHLYRIALEALHNTVKHAHADQATITVSVRAGTVRLAVSDNGSGFDTTASHPGHLGLSTMEQRAQAMGGEIEVASVPGSGTRVVVSVATPGTVAPSAPWRGAAGVAESLTAGSGSADLEHPLPQAAPHLARSPTADSTSASGIDDAPDDRAILRSAAQHLDASAFAAAAALGLQALAGIVAGTDDGVIVVDSDRRYVYANPMACQMLGQPLEQLRGKDFLRNVPVREHGTMLERLRGHFGNTTDPFTSTLVRADGGEREVVYTTSRVDLAGVVHRVVFIQDLTGPRAAARIAGALAQTATSLVGGGSTDNVLEGIARHAANGVRALACDVIVVGDDDRLLSVGAYGLPGPAYGKAKPGCADAYVQAQQVIHAMTGGVIVAGAKPGMAAVLPDARVKWEASPLTQDYAASLATLDWQAGVYIPLSWDSTVFGFLAVYLPSGVSGPSEAELAFYTALADQAAVAIINAQLTSEAKDAAEMVERSRFARDLHDSVSQALFSMTMHARAIQLSLTKSGLEENHPLTQTVAQLGSLTRGAMAQIRALIFELRPESLVEEGLVGALRKQAAALSAYEDVAITVDGPLTRLHLDAHVEEHLYRIATEALHNVTKHAAARAATVHVDLLRKSLRVTVSDDGIGFDTNAAHPGHLGMTTMAERAEAIGANLTIMSTPNDGTTVDIFLTHHRG